LRNKIQVRNKYTGKVYVVAECRLSALPVEKPKSTANGPAGGSKTSNSKTESGKAENLMDSYDLLEKVKGNELVNKK
jgi:isoleucyl-tRNA synthetase